MSNQTPQIKDDPLYRLLREGDVEEFNARRSGGEECDLRGCDFRTLDLRNSGDTAGPRDRVVGYGSFLVG